MSKDYEIIDHTADVGIRAYGCDRRALFENAAKGLLALMVSPDLIEPAETVGIEVQGQDPEDLLVAWLHEILFQFDANRRVFCEVRVEEIGDKNLRASLRGEVFDPNRHEALDEIKAVTYHGARVECKDGQWVAHVLLDA